ncbi:hypothetical protein D3C87_1996300 [compost metagenome]
MQSPSFMPFSALSRNFAELISPMKGCDWPGAPTASAAAASASVRSGALAASAFTQAAVALPSSSSRSLP